MRAVYDKQMGRTGVRVGGLAGWGGGGPLPPPPEHPSRSASGCVKGAHTRGQKGVRGHECLSPLFWKKAATMTAAAPAAAEKKAGRPPEDGDLVRRQRGDDCVYSF